MCKVHSSDSECGAQLYSNENGNAMHGHHTYHLLDAS